jgi:uncharacterized protein YcbK (DUF882 family)
MLITPHFRLSEFDCKDGTQYPLEWVDERLRPLCEVLEVIREAAGGRPLRIISGYRTLSYNRRIGSSDGSQHVQGRAADIQHPHLTAAQLHALVLLLHGGKKLPLLGGLGRYETFTHVDVRATEGRLARWDGSRVGG